MARKDKTPVSEPGPRPYYPQPKEESPLLLTLWREGLRAITLGWDLALPIFAGVLLGSFVDRWLGTRHIFTFGLLALGLMTAYYNIGKVIQRLKKLDEVREREREKQRMLEQEEMKSEE